MSPLGANEQNFIENNTTGEIEIEKVPVHEVEIRQRDLFPVFDHFLIIQSDWGFQVIVISYLCSIYHQVIFELLAVDRRIFFFFLKFLF